MAILEKKTENMKVALLSTPAMQGILVQPRVSEKASHLAGKGKYVFIVAPKANKVEVKKAIEKAYKVKVIQVNIINNKGKVRNFGRTTGRISGFKKAVVTLKQGDKIEDMTETV